VKTSNHKNFVLVFPSLYFNIILLWKVFGNCGSYCIQDARRNMEKEENKGIEESMKVYRNIVCIREAKDLEWERTVAIVDGREGKWGKREREERSDI
jgi:hypothetical protein